jgi:hypothetical protein
MGDIIMSRKLNDLEPLQILEEEMILSIRNSYLECKSFFSKQELTIEEKNSFLKTISLDFFNEFRDHPRILKDNRAIKSLDKNYFVAIRHKDGAFAFPVTFTRFMDRTLNPNIIPKTKINLEILDTYMDSNLNSTNLNYFFNEFFNRLKLLVIPLREREFYVLKLLTKLEFLKFKTKDKRRIIPPTDKDILQALNWEKNQSKSVNRAKMMIHKFNVCFIHGIILNPTKLGFVIVYIENKITTFPMELNKFIFWQIQITNDLGAYILALPFGDIENLIDQNYLVLSDWYWNVNLNHFDRKKDWINYQYINLTGDEKIIKSNNYMRWNLSLNTIPNYTENDIMICKTLSTLQYLTIDTVTKLDPSDKLYSTSIIKSLNKLAKHDVFQLYPSINHLGLNLLLFINFKFDNIINYMNFINILMSFPISSFMTSEETGFGIGYLQIPQQSIKSLVDIINFYNTLKKTDINLYTIIRDYKVSTCFDLNQFNFEIKNSVAYLKAD